MKNSIDIKKLIPSKDVRAQCEKEGRVFNLREQATLVWNNPELGNDERIDLLQEIQMQAKEDSQWKDLSKQIAERIESQLILERRFFNEEEKQFYKIRYWDKESNEYKNSSIFFSDFDHAKKYFYEELWEFSSGTDYSIIKCYLDSGNSCNS